MAARVIGCLTEKGGGGKTATSTHLAVWFSIHYPELKLAVIDLDSAEHFTKWQGRGEKKAGAKRPWKLFSIPNHSAVEVVKHLEGFDVILIDGQPGIEDDNVSMAIIEVCDSIIIPTNPSFGGVDSARKTVQIVRFHKERKEHVKAAICMNRMVRTNTAKDMYEAMHDLNCLALSNTTSFLDIWERAFTEGVTVFELEPEGKAAEEADQLFTELMEKLQ